MHRTTSPRPFVHTQSAHRGTQDAVVLALCLAVSMPAWSADAELEVKDPVPGPVLAIEEPGPCDLKQPRLRAWAVLTSDPAPGGNDSGRIVPGERGQLQIVLENVGDWIARDVRGTLTVMPQDSHVFVESAHGEWPAIEPLHKERMREPRFEIQMFKPANGDKCGPPVELQLHLTAQGYEETVPVQIDPTRGAPSDHVELSDFSRGEEPIGHISNVHDATVVMWSADLNGDGYDDTAYRRRGKGWDEDRPDAGEVWIVMGAREVSRPIDTSGTGDLRFRGQDPGDRLGDALSFGDINGDGYQDLIMGARGGDGPGGDRDAAGEALVVYGHRGFGASTGTVEQRPRTSRIFGVDARDVLGVDVATGDVDGDGFADILLGARGGDGPANTRPEAGEAWIIKGRADYLPPEIDLAATPRGTIVVHGPAAGDALGVSVAFGDVDGDGADEVVLGASGADAAGGTRRDAGQVWLLPGGDLPDRVDLTLPLPGATVFDGADPGDALGRYVTSGDLDDDGLSDLALGASEADGPANERPSCGEVWLVYGSRMREPRIDLGVPQRGVSLFQGEHPFDRLGIRLVLGDADQDEVDDLFLVGWLGDGPPDDQGHRRGDMGYARSGEIWTLRGGTRRFPVRVDLAQAARQRYGVLYQDP